jgi:dihydroorotate dehydrogenase (fumarate)
MADLSTRYLGLNLKNPLVPSASPLSRDLDSARHLEDAGAAALVMYSLFEEQILAEERQYERFIEHQSLGHAEASSFLPDQPGYQSSLDKYLQQLQALKSHLDIPVIASLNGVSEEGWVDYGRELEAAGADALELNVYYVAADMTEPAAAVERR